MLTINDLDSHILFHRPELDNSIPDVPDVVKRLWKKDNRVVMSKKRC